MRRGAPLFLLLAHAACSRPHAEYAAGVTVKPWLRTTVTAGGAPIAYPTGAGEVTLAEVILAPGAETGWHHHPIPVYAFVLEGTLEVVQEGGRAATFTAGQALAEVVGLRHNGTNRGSTRVRLLVAYCGVAGTPATVKAP
jgi:quercetin dioxygenase-like cupin family protein